MFINTSQRTSAPEIMDDFQMEGDMLRDTLDQIAGINRLLGGNRITVQGVRKLIQSLPAGKEIVIVDLGCGNGDMLRTLADVGKEAGRHFRLIGIDANRFTISHAITLSAAYTNITYQVMDIQSPAFAEMQYDIVLCTLTLHHFSDEEIRELMRVMLKNAAVGIVINDLHRSSVAYRLFQLFVFLWRLGPMPKADGLTSILRGFKRKELETLAEKLNIIQYTLRWKWAYRYQWIINKL